MDNYNHIDLSPYEDRLRSLLDEERAIASLTIRAFSDTVGTSDDNISQTTRFADAVRDWFIAEGIDPGRILAMGLGESELDIPTEDEVDQPLNRRMVIEVTFEG